MDQAPGYVQQGRLLTLRTPIGEDMLLPIRFEGREAVGEPFLFEVTARAKRPDLKARDLVGHLVDVGLELDQDGVYRFWNALCVGLVEDAPITRGLRLYKLVLKPQTYLLTQRSDCRIWMDQTTLDVARTLMSEHGLPAPDAGGVTAPPKPQHYSVQWNETDYDYLMRRLEEDGLFHWYAHTEGRHVLTLGDSAHAWRDSGEPRVRFARGSTDRNHISDWSRSFSFTPGKRAGRDWNFETPTTVPEGATPSLIDLPANSAYELYEYPSRIATHTEAEAATRLRMLAAEGDHEGSDGRSTARQLAPGGRFTPYDVARPDDVFEEQVIVAIEHLGQEESYETGVGDATYKNLFRTLAARTPLTPHRKTRRPRIDGTQIAIVAGPSGEEIHTEQYGRIKLWFPWDRRAKKDGTDTCWVRVGQSWGGGQWGQQIIPRIGMEVAVSYLDGDPDRPLVVGVVPNPVNSVPYDLPANKTRMTFRSNTHKGSGFNELSLEDDSGRENLFMHAQKDQTTRVLNTRTKRVDAHEVSSIGANRAVEVGGNQKHEVGGSMNLTVGGTGAQAMGLMGQVAGLAGQTAGLLSQAGQIGGGNPLAFGQMALSLAGSAMGFFGAGGLGARQGVAAGPSPRSDAGTALAGSGQGVGDAASSLFSLPGMLTNVIGSFQSDTVGVARTEQIGVSKVTNVGQTFMENVGKFKKVTVGEEFVVEVGKSKLIMRKDGTVIILGTNFNFTASGPAQLNGSVVDLNKPGAGQKPSPAPQAQGAAQSPMGIDKALSKDAAALAAKSPTLTSDLQALEKQGWSVQQGQPGGGAFADRATKTITIDPNEVGSATAVVQTLAHEVGHARYTPSIDTSSRQAFLNSTLADEGAATLKNIQVQREIIANGGADIGIAGNSANHADYTKAYDAFANGGSEATARNTIGQIFGNGETTSTTNQSYSDYYGGWYDRNYPPPPKK